jgi:phage terminase small subunit
MAKGKQEGESKEKPLTDKEEWFCREYVCEENGTKAYLRVYKCSYDSARSGASSLLTKSNIQVRLEELREERNKRLEISADRVLRELSKLAFYDPRGFFDEDGRLKPISEIDPDQAAVIGGIETIHKVTGEESDGMTVLTKIKLPEKKGALELIGRNLNMWKEVGSKDNPLTGNMEHKHDMSDDMLAAIAAGANG